MAAAVIEVAGLTKSYRRRRGPATRAVDGLDLTVAEGGVHGFLGPNASGKTTTIRMLLGLVAPDAGSMRLLDVDVPSRLHDVVSQIGAIVESPQLFPTFTGRRNLTVLAPIGGVSDDRVEECLAIVGLTERADDLVKGYSLGMRQRLAIAAALLKRPRLLILDEPTNGLDPAGMVEVRDLIGRLGSDGHTTVLLSSHLLGEVQQVCTSVSIINHGRLVVTGPVGQVLAGVRTTGDVRVVVPDPEAGAVALREQGYQVDVTGQALLVRAADDPARVNALLAHAGQWASEVVPSAGSLESAFLELTKEAP
jgi:ABC-2 type transport system ATP-binding protein